MEYLYMYLMWNTYLKSVLLVIDKFPIWCNFEETKLSSHEFLTFKFDQFFIMPNLKEWKYHFWPKLIGKNLTFGQNYTIKSAHIWFLKVLPKWKQQNVPKFLWVTVFLFLPEYNCLECNFVQLAGLAKSIASWYQTAQSW